MELRLKQSSCLEDEALKVWLFGGQQVQKFEFCLVGDGFPETGAPCFVEMVKGATEASAEGFPVIVRETVKRVHFVDEFVLEDGIRLTGSQALGLLDWLFTVDDPYGDALKSELVDEFGQGVVDYLLKYQIAKVVVVEGIEGPVLKDGVNFKTFADALDELCNEVD